MFETVNTVRTAIIYSGGTASSAAEPALRAEAMRRGFVDHDFVCLESSGPVEMELNGVRVAILPVGAQAARVFASTPARVLRAEIAALGADVVIAPGALPFTRIVDGRAWHSPGSLARSANDGTARVWFSIISSGDEPGAIVIEHVALDQTSVSGLWADCGMLPKDEMKLRGVALSGAQVQWSRDAADYVWPVMPQHKPLAPGKFVDTVLTAGGERRASVALDGLRTLWINTGTLCNLSCASCYIESTPRNDRLAYITPAEARAYLDEIARDGLPTREIGFTGGEPFLNPGMIEMMEDALSRGFDVIVLTNAMKPMRHCAEALLALNARYRDKLTMRVSLDHYTQRLHELERGARTWAPAIDGMKWLARHDFRIHVAGRMYSGESEACAREGYRALFSEIGAPVNAQDPMELVLFPEMDANLDVPEITEACWGILHKSPSDVMCASSRMVVKRKGAEAPSVLACTLLAYDERFELGRTLAQASGPVSLNHPHCAKFCVLGGAACSRS